MTMLPAILSLLFIIHVCLIFTTRKSSFWWIARGLDALEAGQRTTWMCMGPFWRRWKRVFKVELARMARVVGEA